ncbi:MAG TPA: arylesterase [Longimicrobiaceae bacterium]|nr:arylesterase [Longimicrobiaceae bacterium]
MSIRRWVRGLALPGVALMIGCAGEEGNSAPADTPPAAEDAAGAPAPPTVLFLGTSLTAGPGIDPADAYPALIQARIDSAGLPFRVVNAGSSGETSAGALRRLEWLLRQPFDVLVLETGANDMLNGVPVDSIRANLQRIIDRVRRERPNAQIVLVGMLAMPNLGREYGEEFGALYPGLARENGLPLVPFLLEGVGGVPALNLPDGIHPNEAGHRRVAATVWRTLEPVLRARAPA